MKVVYEFNEQLIQQLNELYQKEWWTKERSLEETKGIVNGSQINIGIVDAEGALQAYARVLTDYTIKALILDVIVLEAQRGNGLGNRLLSLIKEHEELQHVKHFELICLPEMITFYQKQGFSADVGGVKLMRFTKV